MKQWSSEPAAVEHASPRCQDDRSRSAPRHPRLPARCHGDARAAAHLSTGDPRQADQRPVEPDHTADRSTAGKINDQ